MKLSDEISREELVSMIHAIIGKDWSVSIQTEITPLEDVHGAYFWNLYLHRFKENELEDYAVKRFTIFNHSEVPVRVQLHDVLSLVAEEIEIRVANRHHGYLDMKGQRNQRMG